MSDPIDTDIAAIAREIASDRSVHTCDYRHDACPGCTLSDVAREIDSLRAEKEWFKAHSTNMNTKYNNLRNKTDRLQTKLDSIKCICLGLPDPEFDRDCPIHGDGDTE